MESPFWFGTSANRKDTPSKCWRENWRMISEVDTYLATIKSDPHPISDGLNPRL